jgi:ZIP family zinc transporter
MADFFAQFSPVMQALIGTLFTWGMTALGARPSFCERVRAANYWI